MRSLWVSACVFTFAVVLAAGCNRESNKGGPGAKDKDNKPAAGATAGGAGASGAAANAGDKGSFNIKAPAGSTNVTQGEKTEVTVTVNRNDNFDKDVTLKFEPTEGLKVEPATATAQKGKDDVRVTVHANPDAKVGTTNVKVTGTGAGASGPPATVELGIEVKKK